MDPGDWNEPARAFAAFLCDRKMIAPDPALLEDPKREAELAAWIRDEDWQLLRNKAAFPRSWVVHRARFLKPIADITSADGERLLRQMLFANDAIWHDRAQPVYDPHTLAWIEVDDPRPLASYARGGAPDGDETVTIMRYGPQRVEIETRLNRPGIVVLADTYYPGWTLTLDDRPAPILRTNRLMRGPAVGAGKHRLVYRYRPLSFRIGILLSLASAGAALRLAVAARPRPPDTAERRR